MFLITHSNFRLLQTIDIVREPCRAFIWWYTQGIRGVVRFFSYHFWALEDQFSFREMLSQIPRFEPLHRDYGSNFMERIVVRLIGVVFRTGWIVVTGFILLFMLFMTVLALLLWIFLPIFLLIELLFTLLYLIGIDLTFLHTSIGAFLEDVFYSF